MAEAYTGLSSDWQSLEPHNKQHMLMYSFFVINGLFDILVMSRHLDQAQPPLRNVVLPPDTQRMTLLQALIVEFVLFSFHLLNRSELDRHLHILLLLCNAFAIVAALVEWSFQNHMLAALFRAFTAILMGTWFIQVTNNVISDENAFCLHSTCSHIYFPSPFQQIAFILHNPFTDKMTWPTEGHHAIMEATSLYVFHALVNTLFILLIGLFSFKAGRPGYDGLATEVKKNSNVNPAMDSEEEYEFNVESASSLTHVSTDPKQINYR